VTQTFKNLRFANPQPINHLQAAHPPSRPCGNHSLCTLKIGEEHHASPSPVEKGGRRAKFGPPATFNNVCFQ
jgi:hypothetical protein